MTLDIRSILALALMAVSPTVDKEVAVAEKKLLDEVDKLQSKYGHNKVIFKLFGHTVKMGISDEDFDAVRQDIKNAASNANVTTVQQLIDSLKGIK